MHLKRGAPVMLLGNQPCMTENTPGQQHGTMQHVVVAFNCSHAQHFGGHPYMCELSMVMWLPDPCVAVGK